MGKRFDAKTGVMIKAKIRELVKAGLSNAHIAAALSEEGFKTGDGSAPDEKFVYRQMAIMRRQGRRLPARPNERKYRRRRVAAASISNAKVSRSAPNDERHTLAELVLTLKLPKATKLQVIEALL